MRTKAKKAAAMARKRGEAFEALEALEVYFETAESYGEQGYSSDHPVIVLANWNDVPKGLVRFVESVAEIEWSDEWVIDSDGRAFRSSPDSYGWTQAWFDHEGEIVPYDTLPERGEDLLQAARDYGRIYSPGDCGPFHAFPLDYFSRERFETIATLVTEDLQNGWHPGQNDTPEKALANLPADGEYFFTISDVGQFDLTFEVWKLTDPEASFNSFSIALPWEAVGDMSGPGPADSAVSHWSSIVSRPDACTPDALASELKEYGAWDAEELEDDTENWGRILWIAAGNIREENKAA